MDDNKKIIDKFRVEMSEFITKVSDLGDEFFVSGFVFNLEDQFLMHFGNVSPEGNLVRMHTFLAAYIQHMMEEGNTSSVETPEEGERNPVTAKDVGDKLAAAVFAAPPEVIPEEIRNIASEYLTTRLEGR